MIVSIIISTSIIIVIGVTIYLQYSPGGYDDAYNDDDNGNDNHTGNDDDNDIHKITINNNDNNDIIRTMIMMQKRSNTVRMISTTITKQ